MADAQQPNTGIILDDLTGLLDADDTPLACRYIASAYKTAPMYNAAIISIAQYADGFHSSMYGPAITANTHHILLFRQFMSDMQKYLPDQSITDGAAPFFHLTKIATQAPLFRYGVKSSI